MAHTSLNPASPWVVDVRSLGRRPGSYKPLVLDLPVTTPIGLPVIAVPVGASVAADLRLESVTEGVLVSGTASAVAHGECSRCLTEVDLAVTAPLRELFAYPGSTTDETTDTDELPRVQDDLIDLEPLITDEITIALPLVPLCRQDCAGLCPDCGEHLDELEQGHIHEILDPRWAALADKFAEPSPRDEQDSSPRPAPSLKEK